MSGVPHSQARALATEIADRTRQFNVRLASAEMASSPPTRQDRLRVEVELSLGAAVGDGQVVCTSQYDLRASPDNAGKDGPEAWSISIEVQGRWQCDTVGLTHAHAQAFALTLGSLTLHPYARSQVQSLVAASGHAPFVLEALPTLIDQSELEVDLEIVHVPKAAVIWPDSNASLNRH